MVSLEPGLDQSANHVLPRRASCFVYSLLFSNFSVWIFNVFLDYILYDSNDEVLPEAMV